MPSDEKRNNLGLWVVLGVSCVAIVGLAIANLILSQREDHADEAVVTDEVFYTESASAKAGVIYGNIKTKLESEENYDLSKAEQEFESEIETADSEMRIQIAIEYANFIYEETGDATRAVDILKSVEQSVGERSQVDYYVAIRYFYDKAGDAENATYYEEKIKELVPEIMDQDTVTGGA